MVRTASGLAGGGGMSEDTRALVGRVDTWTTQVKCVNTECPDHGVLRLISIPHLGNSVFLRPTATGPLGIPVANLLCGTCKGSQFVEVIVD